MEELSRLHKDVPFGWFAMLQDFLSRRAERRARQTAPRSRKKGFPTLPGDLHHLAGPH